MYGNCVDFVVEKVLVFAVDDRIAEQNERIESPGEVEGDISKFEIELLDEEFGE